ncbi:phosphatase PAP2 family protein [Methylobrevis pamukkalensis]|uniref:PAP2 superfamily protein n=1 Tax=Methylobrevis pamukkalensis TaxID=1439726 RepID=A0A1E3H047_9HYPH|nr:phosphatase PAP2 family protein [Methylobrevis pamukkalensis]ODN69662.1 PAP2 superfamily protein [Methylobrevis pamukkalensis]
MPMLTLAATLVRVVVFVPKRRGLMLRMMFAPHRLGRLLAGCLLMAAMAVWQGTFTTVKSALVTAVGGFPADRFFADLEAALFGVDPWRLLHGPSAGSEGMLRLAELNYGILWSVAMMAMLYFVATSPRADGLRLRYFASFILTWFLLGNVFAAAGMSAGPVYFGAVTGDTARFAELVATLSATSDLPFSAANLQAYLWQAHVGGQGGFGTGISAFPSLHVGVMTLNALFLRELDRRLGLAAFAYAGLIWVSSVYLGWHYVVDGAFSVAVVLALHPLLRRAFRAARA